MPFYRGGEGVTSDFGFGDVNSSRLDAFIGSAKQGFHDSLISQSGRAAADFEAKTGMPMPPPGTLVMPSDMIQFQLDNRKEIKLLSKTDAESRVKEAGVKLAIPERGISEDYLKLLIERKRDQAVRDLAIQRAPDGVVSGTVNLLGGIAGSLADPTNIAASFIPVVGEAKYAAMLERAGASALARTGVRAGVGAVEGAVGQAMIEPFTALDKLSNQEDYGLGTAAMDIGFGGVFGSAMHVGTHAIGRAIGEARERWGKFDDPNSAINVADRVSPDINEAAVRAIASADAMGKRIDVEAIIKLDPRAEERLTPEKVAEREAYAEDYARRRLGAMAEEAKANPDSVFKGLMDEGRAEWKESQMHQANTPVEGDMAEVKRAVQESRNPEADRVADFKAAQEADAKLPDTKMDSELETVKAETDEIIRQVKEIEKLRGIEFAELKAADEAAARAQTFAKATKAAAVCGVKF